MVKIAQDYLWDGCLFVCDYGTIYTWNTVLTKPYTHEKNGGNLNGCNYI